MQQGWGAVDRLWSVEGWWLVRIKRSAYGTQVRHQEAPPGSAVGVQGSRELRRPPHHDRTLRPEWKLDFQATGGNAQFCRDEGLCTDARCNSWCRATDVISSSCNGDNGPCPGGTKPKYTSGTLLFACLHSNPSLCRCSCQASAAPYQAETPLTCTTCGDGVCNGDTEWCDTCPGDCPQTVMSLPGSQCVICERTGEMHCGPGTFQWCCY